MLSFVFTDQSVGKKHPKPIAYEDLNVPITEIVKLTPANVRKCVGALVRYEGGPFRERHDGGLAVSSASILTASGYLRSDGDEYFYGREEALRLTMILDMLGPLTPTEGMLRVTYYG